MSPKHKIIFSSVVRCQTNPEKSKFLSTASLKDLQRIIPSECLKDGFQDVLPIASNLSALGIRNKNGHTAHPEIAKVLANSLKHKFINVEHDRSKICGTVLQSAFSRFDVKYAEGFGSEIIPEEEIEALKEPFNLSYAALIYSLAYPKLSEMLMDASDVSSKNYSSISSSWEVAYDIARLAIGSPNVFEAKILTDEKQIKEMEPFLLSNGGPGEYKGEYIYQVLDKDSGVISLGVGLTMSPASAVMGVQVHDKSLSSMIAEVKKDDAFTQLPESITLTNPEIDEKNVENSEIIANNIKKVTKPENKSVITTEKIMVINKITDLTDESLKEIKASVITDLLQTEIKKANETYEKQVAEKEKAILASENSLKELASAKDSLDKQLKEVQAALAKLETEAKEKEKTEKFNTRMASLDNLYTLEAEHRQIIAARIKDISDADYANYEKELGVFLKASKKGEIKSDKEIKASVETVLDPLKAKNEIPNTVLTEASLQALYKAAFNEKTVTIK